MNRSFAVWGIRRLNNRLYQIYEVSSNLFINKGYARTQIKDIADGIGMSVGTMYHYFVGKADILSFILKVTIEPEFMEQDFALPIQPVLFDNLGAEIKATFAAREEAFARSYRQNHMTYTYEQMLSDAFDTIWQYGKGFLLIEKNPDDMKEIAKDYGHYRNKFFGQMLQYVIRFQENGVCRALDMPELSTRLMVETIAWWGMHIMNDAFSPQTDISKDVAKSVCMDALINAYKI